MRSAHIWYQANYFTQSASLTNLVNNSTSSNNNRKSESKMESLEVQLQEFVAMHDWKKIIQLNECYSLSERSRFLWAWPSENCLQKLKIVLLRKCVQSILSIGCGSGLFEWILEETAGLPVSGIELANSLWTSNYSPSKFIKVNFIDGDPSTKYLQGCATSVENFALLFCYFNNRPAFDKYVKEYTGNVVIIVGPRNDCGIVTDPLPMNPHFSNECQWVVESVIDIGDGCNVVVVYKRE